MTGTEAPPCPAPRATAHPPRFEMPPGATDSHAHVFRRTAHPYQPERAYTPPDCTAEDLRALHRTLGIERLVVVQASVHGTDPGAVCATVASDPANIRGICAVAENVTDAELRNLHDQGVRGARFNLVDKGGMPFRSLAELAAFSRRIADMGWHVELLVHVADAIDDLRALAAQIAVPMSVGHIGYTKTARGGLAAPGFQEFLSMLRDGHFWVKLTGPYRISAEPAPPYGDAAGMARAVVEAAPDRILWGSDWPHVMVHGHMPDDGDLLDLLADWVPDPDLRRAVLVDNPARLYGF